MTGTTPKDDETRRRAWHAMLSRVNGDLTAAVEHLDEVPIEAFGDEEDYWQAKRLITQAGQIVARNESTREATGRGTAYVTDYATSGHGELWISCLPDDRGPEGNVEMWEGAERFLDGLCKMTENGWPNEAVHTALVDAYNRCTEERRRAQDLLGLHAKWSGRRIGGVAEPRD